MKVDGWKLVKVLGLGLTIIGGVATAISDFPELKDAAKDLKGTPKLPGQNIKKS